MSNKRIVIKGWLLFLTGIMLSFYSCEYSDSSRMNIDGESYLLMLPGKSHNHLKKYQKDGIVLYTAQVDRLGSESNDLYDYSLSIDVLLPDSLEVEGKRLPLSNALLKEKYMDVWWGLYSSNDTTKSSIIDDVKAFICVNREWYVYSHSKALTSDHSKPFYGVDGWLIINKLNDKYNVEFDCTVVAEEDGESFRVVGYNGK